MSSFVISILLTSMVFLTACSDDEEPNQEPCEELCGGILRCMQSNQACTDDGTLPGYTQAQCVSQCEAIVSQASTSELAEAESCLSCLRGQSGQLDMSCDGEMLLDDDCDAPCKTDGAALFRDGNFPVDGNNNWLGECINTPQ